ncbi:sensor histidine kinase [Pseudopedobacter beijingensis]
MVTFPFLKLYFRKVFSILWLIWLAIHVHTLYSLGIPLELALKDSLFSLLLISLAGCLISNILAFYQPDKDSYTYVTVCCFALSLLCVGIMKWVLPALAPELAMYQSFLAASMPIRFAFTLLLIGWMAVISVLWYRQQDRNEAERIKIEADRMNKEAELASLRDKLQPHFLFNSLNSISALTVTKPEEARKMVYQLSEFLRGTIKKDNKPSALLTEIEHLKLYLEIEKVRFGNRLVTDIVCEDIGDDIWVPSMILQPIVENAIKFGLYDTLDKVTIGIRCKRVNDSVIISVSNPFDPETAYPQKGTGFGLESVKRRLWLLYNQSGLVKTAYQDNLFITTLNIPQV